MTSLSPSSEVRLLRDQTCVRLPRDFASLPTSANYSIFIPLRLFQRQWDLQLYTNGNKKENKGYISLYLYYRDGGTFYATFNISIVSRNGDEATNSRQYRDALAFEKNAPLRDGRTTRGMYRAVDNWGNAQFCTRAQLVDDIANGIDHIRVVMWNLTSIDTVPTSIPAGDLSAVESASRERFLCDMKALCEHKWHSDVTFVVEDTEMRAHKSILSARSAVFERMFSGDWERASDEPIPIEETTETAFAMLLRYYYTDTVEPCDDTDEWFALRLLAERYEAPHLKQICENALRSRINVETVCALLEWTTMLDDSDWLRDACMEFWRTYKDQIVNTEGFEKMSGDAARLLVCDKQAPKEVVEKKTKTRWIFF